MGKSVNSPEARAAAKETILSVMTESDRPMTSGEFFHHPAIRQVGLTRGTVGQHLKHLVRQGLVIKKGQGTLFATYRKSTPVDAAARDQVRSGKTNGIGPAPKGVIVLNLTKEGRVRSVQAPAGETVVFQYE